MTQFEQRWIIPDDPNDMAPLPALVDGTRISAYDRQRKTFRDPEIIFYQLFDSFEECRTAMIAARSSQLEADNRHCRELAASIEHIRTIPSVPFPGDPENVLREVRIKGQEKEEEAEKQKIQAEQVRPELQQRPRRK